MQRIRILVVVLAAALVGTLSNAVGKAAQVTFDPQQRHQTIEGFGTMWTYWAWLPQYDDPKFFDMVVNDLGVSLLRIEIPGTLEPANDDADPNHFNWSNYNIREMDRLLRFAQEFKKRGVKRFLGDTFSPAAFLKTNRALDWGGYLRADKWDEYAEFMAAFIILSQQNWGVNITDITIQNELLFIEFYGSCVYSPEAAREATRALMRRFAKEGITTRIHMPEDMMFHDRMLTYITPTMNDPETRDFPGAFATHRQGGFNEVRRWRETTRQYAHQNWMTETSGHPQNWTGAMKMASDIYDYLVGGDYSVWVYLRLTQPAGGDGALTVDGKPAPKYYAAKHYYRYIRPGAVRIDANSSDPDLLVSAFTHDVDGTATLVLINRAKREMPVDLKGIGKALPAQYTLYRSTDTEGCVDQGAVPADAPFTMPPLSMVTLYGKSAALKTKDSLPDPPMAFKSSIPALAGVTPGQRLGDMRELVTPGIVYAAGRPGDVAAVKRELANGVDINTTDYQGWTALHWAILNCKNNVIEALLAAKADVNRPAADGWTPLHMAAAGFHNDRYSSFKLIMQAKPDINAQARDGWTPLHAAAASAHVAWSQKEDDSLNRVRDLIASGAKLEAPDVHGRTPLHWAAMQGYQVQLAIRDGVIQVLLNAGANVQAVDDQGRTPLHYAAEQGYNAILAALLKAGASVDARDKAGATPLSLAQGRTLTETVKLLQSNKAQVAPAAQPATPQANLGPELIKAAKAGDIEQVKRLLARGADPSYMDSDGFRAADRARDYGHPAIVDLLEKQQGDRPKAGK